MTYTLLRKKGFTMTPLSAKKLPAMGGILFASIFGSLFGQSFATAALGNNAYKNYLLQNRSAILSGEASMDN